MTNFVAELETIKRPKLLLRTARLGIDYYRRAYHLPKILGYDGNLSQEHILRELIEIEETTNEKRRTNDASYSLHFHIEVLAALLSEAHDACATPTNVT